MTTRVQKYCDGALLIIDHPDGFGMRDRMNLTSHDVQIAFLLLTNRQRELPEGWYLVKKDYWRGGMFERIREMGFECETSTMIDESGVQRQTVRVTEEVLMMLKMLVAPAYVQK